MNIWKISFSNIKLKPLYTILSVLMLSLSITLLLGIQQLQSSFKYQIENNIGAIDLVIGAKGSPLQLVLSSVLHIDNPTGNIALKDAKKFMKNPFVKSAVPISYGDNFKGYKIIGTTPDFLKFYKAELNEGNSFKKSFEVIVGSAIADKLNLKIGDTFLSFHGLIENSIDVHDDEFVVVGILKPTQKVIDRLIVTNLESIWDVHNHDEHEHSEHKEDESHEHDDHKHEHHKHEKNNVEHKHEAHEHEHEHEAEHEHHEDEEHQEEDDKEITSLLISFRNPAALLTFPRNINKNTNMQAAIPKYELDKLYEYTGVGFTTITYIAYLILIISGLTIFISLYKMVKERAFDLALLRTYGATNFQLIRIISNEALLIIGTAFVVALILVKIGLTYLISFIDSPIKQNMLQGLSFEQVLYTFGMVLIMGIISVLLAINPIIKMRISTIISNEK